MAEPKRKRIRITIEIDMPKDFRVSSINLRASAGDIASDCKGDLVYLATEIVENHHQVFKMEINEK